MKFEQTEKGRELAAKSNEAVSRITQIRDRRCQLLNDLAEINAGLADAEALESIGESSAKLASLRANVENLKSEIARLDANLIALDRGCKLLGDRMREAREQFRSDLEPRLRERHAKAVSKLVWALEAAAKFNADVAAIENEFRDSGIALGGSLLYGDLSHEFVGDTANGFGFVRNAQFTTTYSRWLGKCAAMGIEVPKGGPSVPASVNPNLTGNAEQFQAGVASQATVTRPIMAAARDLIGRFVNYLGVDAASVGL